MRISSAETSSAVATRMETEEVIAESSAFLPSQERRWKGTCAARSFHHRRRKASTSIVHQRGARRVSGGTTHSRRCRSHSRHCLESSLFFLSSRDGGVGAFIAVGNDDRPSVR